MTILMCLYKKVQKKINLRDRKNLNIFTPKEEFFKHFN